MGFAQLYYTSCESGLSDFAGFQFNAATPGLPPQVLREVEALTSYEPPRSLGYRPSPADIASCPVNLVYHCEPTPVLANVVFVGLDFSQRLGNYFAHALVAQTDADRFDQVLPIELWGSPVWVSKPIAGRDLPALPCLPDLPDPVDPTYVPDPTYAPDPADVPSPGSQRISRTGVDDFLAERDCLDQVTALVTAAETAVLRQGRSIVIIESDSTAAAHWIAAISFLLPPDVARRMSFATYRHRPEYATAHVVATLPESDFDLDESSFHSYVVFDAASGRISELAPDPAAALLVRAGAERAALLWERTAELIDRPPVALAEGYPLLVAAAILEHLPVVDAELEVLADWLESNPGIQLEDDVRLFPPLRRAALLARCRSTLVRPTTQPYLAAPAQPINPANPTGPTSPTGPVDSMGSTSDWLVRALLEPARDGAYLPVYLALCQGIDDGTLSERLPPPAHHAVSSFLSVVRDLERVRTEPEDAKVISLRTLAGSYSQQPVTVQDLLRAALPEQIDELVGSPHLAGVVASWPGDIVTAYLEAAARQLAHRPTDAAAAARLFETLQALHSGQETVLAPALAEELRKGLRTWSQNELDQLQDQLRQNDSRLSTRFTEWRDQHLGGILSRSLRRLALRRSRTGAGE